MNDTHCRGCALLLYKTVGVQNECLVKNSPGSQDSPIVKRGYHIEEYSPDFCIEKRLLGDGDKEEFCRPDVNIPGSCVSPMANTQVDDKNE